MNGSRPPFDLDAAFDQDYIDFYSPYTTPQRSDDEAALIGGLLRLAPGEKVLDLACGTGRIALRLAATGCKVTGLDQSTLFLESAQQDADRSRVEVLWLQGDQRRLHFVDEFDAVVSWFTCFGYDDDATSRDILQRVYRALMPGGRFLVETINVFQAAFDDGRQVKQAGRGRMTDRKTFDPLGGYVTYVRKVTRPGSEPRSFTFSVRLFSPAELRCWLESIGFVEVEAFGERGEHFTAESTRLIMVARKPG